MVRAAPLALASVLGLAALLSGCSGKAAGQDTTSGFLEAAPAAADKGAVSGVVVDQAIRPLANANVTLGKLGSTRTDAQGRFTFNDVDPGFVVLMASAKGYFATQATADVKAGETARVRIQLLADLSPTPYHVTLQFKGFIEAWGGIAQFFVEEAYSTATGNGTSLCQCYYKFTPDLNLSGMVLEAVWSDSAPHPTGAEDDQYYTNVNQADSDMFEQNYCSSPCRVDVSLGDYKQGAQTEAYMQGPDEYVAVNQDYQMYISLFYRAPQPAKWSFVAGDP